MSNSSCMKNSFCYLSAHGFLRASQGQTPGGGEAAPANHWEGLPSPASAAPVAHGRGPGDPALGALPAGPWPVPPPFTLVSPSSHAVAVCDVSPGSLFGLPPSPLSPPSPPPPKPRSFVPAHPPVLPAPLLFLSFELAFLMISSLFLSSLAYLKHRSLLLLPVQGRFLKVLVTFTR